MLHRIQESTVAYRSSQKIVRASVESLDAMKAFAAGQTLKASHLMAGIAGPCPDSTAYHHPAHQSLHKRPVRQFAASALCFAKTGSCYGLLLLSDASELPSRCKVLGFDLTISSRLHRTRTPFPSRRTAAMLHSGQPINCKCTGHIQIWKISQ